MGFDIFVSVCGSGRCVIVFPTLTRVSRALILLISIVLSIVRSLWGIEDDPDNIFSDWGRDGTETENLAWYPTDFLRDVTPVPCHSHNDYWRRVPLFSALHAGCTGVEADVWLFNNGSELFVGHDRAALTPHRTFQSLYVNPLVEIIERNNPETPFYNASDAHRGVFDTNPDQTLVLLVDLKTDGAKTLPQVEAQLEPLRARNWLTYVKDGIVHERQVTVVGTGRTPFDMLTRNSTYRDIFFDAPLRELYEDPDVPDTDEDDGPFVYNNTNSLYASVNFLRAIGSVVSNSRNHFLLVHGDCSSLHGAFLGKENVSEASVSKHSQIILQMAIANPERCSGLISATNNSDSSEDK